MRSSTLCKFAFWDLSGEWLTDFESPANNNNNNKQNSPFHDYKTQKNWHKNTLTAQYKLQWFRNGNHWQRLLQKGLF